MLIEELFCSKIIIENRRLVRNSPVKYIPEINDTIIGCIYEKDGRYHKYLLPYSEDNIARFICSDNKDKLICNSEEFALLNTQGKYLDLCIDNPDFLNNIRKELIKYQSKNTNTKFNKLD